MMGWLAYSLYLCLNQEVERNSSTLMTLGRYIVLPLPSKLMMVLLSFYIYFTLYWCYAMFSFLVYVKFIWRQRIMCKTISSWLYKSDWKKESYCMHSFRLLYVKKNYVLFSVKWIFLSNLQYHTALEPIYVLKAYYEINEIDHTHCLFNL